MKYAAISEGRRIEIEFTRERSGSVESRIDGRTYNLETIEVDSGVYWFNWNNRSIEVTVTKDGDRYTVSLGSYRIPVEILDARAALRRPGHHTHDGTAEVRAPMPGKVIRVLVAEGEAVKTNQGLVVVEAMKMQNEIKSPRPGVVRLAAIEGSTVNAGELLATVE